MSNGYLVEVFKIQEESTEEGIKSIKLCIYFYTAGAGVRLPKKTAFKAGWVSMPTNHLQGIRASDAQRVPFRQRQRTLMEAIQETLKAHKINLVEEEKAGEYRKFLKSKKQEEEFFDPNYNV